MEVTRGGIGAELVAGFVILVLPRVVLTVGIGLLLVLLMALCMSLLLLPAVILMPVFVGVFMVLVEMVVGCVTDAETVGLLGLLVLAKSSSTLAAASSSSLRSTSASELFTEEAAVEVKSCARFRR